MRILQLPRMSTDKPYRNYRHKDNGDRPDHLHQSFILFPELEKLVPTLHMTSVYSLLYEFPGASYIASAHLTQLTNLFSKASKSHYSKDTPVLFRDSIGSVMPVKSLELKTYHQTHSEINF